MEPRRVLQDKAGDGATPIRNLYRRLLTRFGPQGWWPVTPKGARMPRYHPGSFPDLSERQKFEVACGAILTQNTAWKNALDALGKLMAADSLTVGGLTRIPARRLESLVRTSGYYRQKAFKLKSFAKHVWSCHAGRMGAWLKGDLSLLRSELLGLYGIGPETADSILLYAGGRRVFVVDAYTRRIVGRLGLLKTDDYGRVQAAFEKDLPRSATAYQEVHALLVELAKRHCTKHAPGCPSCPLVTDCRYGRGRACPRTRRDAARACPRMRRDAARACTGEGTAKRRTGPSGSRHRPS